MKWCLDKRVLIGLAVVAVGVVVFARQYAATLLPVLALLACPLSMVFMMRGTRGQPRPVDDAALDRLREEIDAVKAQLHVRRASGKQPGSDSAG